MNPARARVVAGGMLLLQLGWFLAVPPFRGIDEWDHAYRAGAVAEGQWRAAPEGATRGTGAVLDVPRDLVEAAHDECARMPYAGQAECVGSDRGGDTVQVASGAGRYHPLFYAVTGYLTAPFEGVARLYAMRAVAAAACLGLFGLALGSMRRWSDGPGAWAGLAIALTPTVVYTTTVMAPNGVELMAGLALWSALIGLAMGGDPARDNYQLAVVSVTGPLLVSVRSLGPLWLLLIFATCLVALPVPRERLVLLLARPLGRLATGLVSVATASSIWWILGQRSLELGAADRAFSLTWFDRLAEAMGQLPLWLFQAIGAFPYRDNPAPPWVYACWLLLAGVFLGAAVRHASPTLRRAVLLGLGLSALVPFLITVATVTSYGTAWQGRYGLPYSLGLLLLAGLAWDRAELPVGPRLWVPGGVMFVVGSLLGPVAVLLVERVESPWAGRAAWPAPHPALLATLVVAAAVLIWLAALGRTAPDRAGSRP